MDASSDDTSSPGLPTAGAMRGTVLLAWAVTLAVSILPDVAWNTLLGPTPSWFLSAKIGILVMLAALSFGWRTARPLRRYALVLITLLLAALLQKGEDFASWQKLFPPDDFTCGMMGIQILRLAGACVMIGALVVLRFRPADFYLVKGNPAAPAERIPWLGIDKGTPWNRIGPISAGCISLGTLAFLLLAGRPSISALAAIVWPLPVILLLAAMNAFSEELMYRGALLAPLKLVLGPGGAVMLSAVYFGIGHYYGVPYGPPGVVMAGLLGWFLGRSMVDTRGFGWAWFVHFLQDVMIFTFMAAGAVSAGGR